MNSSRFLTRKVVFDDEEKEVNAELTSESDKLIKASSENRDNAFNELRKVKIGYMFKADLDVDKKSHDDNFNEDRKASKSDIETLSKVITMVKLTMKNIEDFKKARLMENFKAVFNHYVGNGNINDYIGKIFPVNLKLEDSVIPIEFKGIIGSVSLIKYDLLHSLPKKVLHNLYKKLSETKPTDKIMTADQKELLLRFIQVCRHFPYLEEMLEVEYKESSVCASCSLSPLVGCYWKKGPLGKDKYCLKCFIRGRPFEDGGKTIHLNHFSYKGLPASLIDNLTWNE